MRRVSIALGTAEDENPTRPLTNTYCSLELPVWSTAQ